MAHTYTCILIHAVFSTKQRQPHLTDEVKAELFPYLAGSLAPMKGKAVIVNGPRDQRPSSFLAPSGAALVGRHGEIEGQLLQVG